MLAELHKLNLRWQVSNGERETESGRHSSLTHSLDLSIIVCKMRIWHFPHRTHHLWNYKVCFCKKQPEKKSAILPVDSLLRVLWYIESTHNSQLVKSWRWAGQTCRAADTTSAGMWSRGGFAWTISEKPGHHQEMMPNWDHPGQTCLVPIAFRLNQDNQILLKIPTPKGLVINFSLESQCW